MKKSFYFLLLIPLIILSACKKNTDYNANPDKSDVSAGLNQMVSETYDNYMAKYPGFPGGFVIQVLSAKGDGFAQQGVDASLTNRYHFRAQSTTKTITAAGIMLLHQQGLLDFRQLITDTIPGTDYPYLPATPDYDIPYKDQITIWDLLTHRAGVWDLVNTEIGQAFLDSILLVNPDHTFSIDELTRFIAEHQLSHFTPGESWHYSNSGYQLLAKIIERVSGKTYRQFMTDEFVIPLGLTDTSFPDQGSDQTIPGPFVDSWAWVEGQSYNLTEQNMSANVGEGNMISSARDLSRFYQLLLKGEARVDIAHVSKYMMDCRLISPISSVGYGTGLFHYVNLGYGHGGDGAGFTIRCFTDPYSDFTVLGFFNCWNYKEGPGDRSYFNETDELLWNLLYRVKGEITGY